jgi:PadR family transcriptional regulator, regulatory protein PadR
MDPEAALRELRRGTVQYCVLAVLRDEQMYGIDLVRRLDEIGGLVTSLGTIYPLLARLRNDGLVTATERPSQAGPARRYYQLTAQGRGALADFVAEWSRFRDAVDRLLTKGGHGAWSS